MGKGKEEHRRTYYVVLQGRSPGVYADKRQAQAQLKGVRGGVIRPLYRATREEARSFFQRAKERGEVRILGPKGESKPVGSPLPPGGRLVRIDGSLKEGRASSSAVVLSQGDGPPLAQGEVYLRHGTSSVEAEMRALVLGLLLLRPGDEAVVWSDLEALERYWYAKEPPPLVAAAKALAAALGLKVHVKKVPRAQVQQAHQGAAQARREGERVAATVEALNGLLGRIPPNYRHTALDYLTKAAGRDMTGEGFLRVLGRSATETARWLLREIQGPEQAEAYLQAAKELNGRGPALLQALKEKDRERAMALKPPSERQLALLRSLGYEGPPPKNMLEASRKIDALLG